MNFIEISNYKKYELTLTVAEKTKLPSKFISQIAEKITFISENKTYYCYFSEKSKITRSSLFKLFVALAKQKKLFADHINVDVKAFVITCITEAEVLQTIYEALLFGAHKPYSLKTKPESSEAEVIKFNLMTTEPLPKYTCETQIVTSSIAINETRDLQDTPPNLLTPSIFAEKIAQTALNIENLKVTILDKQAIIAAKMNLLLAVSAGSYEEPRVVVLEYQGASESEEVVGFVGKGITFDSGGYSLKPSTAMKGMKYDMSGAAIVCSAAIAAAKLGLKTNFVAVVCLTENRIGGKATLVETVVTSMNGKTVEINNTDAEGRLVLADGITYAIRKGKANKIIDLATLTGAISIILGDYMTGAFSNNDELYESFLKATKQTNEEIWRLPIHEQNVKYMYTSHIADLSNIAPSHKGASSNAAAFLQEFVEDKPFLHLDIAGTASDNDKKGLGVMVKSLVQYLKNGQKN